jgi:hypothetical protein
MCFEMSPRPVLTNVTHRVSVSVTLTMHNLYLLDVRERAPIDDEGELCEALN